MFKEYSMPQELDTTILAPVLEALISKEGDGLSKAITMLLNLSARLEREQALQAKSYERTDDRKGYANGYKDKTLNTRIGKLKVKIPQARGMDFYPSSIEKGIRSERALKLAIAEMYIRGVSTRKVSRIVEKLCGVEVSESQVTKASQELDTEIEKWRNRELGEYHYLILDATYEKVRIGGSVVSAAVLIAYGINPSGVRVCLGTDVSLSEASVHWRKFLESLVSRKLHGLKFITSDNHSGLKNALNAVFPGVRWQRCQFHLQQNAQKYITKLEYKKEVAADIRTVYNAPTYEEAMRYLREKCDKYRDKQPKLSEWMELNIPEGLAVFTLPEAHRRKMRTSNMAERQMKEIKRRTKVAMIFPNEKSIIRLVTALLMETSEQWENGKVYLTMDTN
jgi:transposase-like protein